MPPRTILQLQTSFKLLIVIVSLLTLLQHQAVHNQCTDMYACNLILVSAISLRHKLTQTNSMIKNEPQIFRIVSKTIDKRPITSSCIKASVLKATALTLLSDLRSIVSNALQSLGHQDGIWKCQHENQTFFYILKKKHMVRQKGYTIFNTCMQQQLITNRF